MKSDCILSSISSFAFPNTTHRMSNKKEFAEMLRCSRLNELSCPPRVAAIRAGLSTVVPFESLKILTAQDLALRLCGVPYVNLNYLRVSMLRPWVGQ